MHLVFLLSSKMISIVRGPGFGSINLTAPTVSIGMHMYTSLPHTFLSLTIPLPKRRDNSTRPSYSNIYSWWHLHFLIFVIASSYTNDLQSLVSPLFLTNSMDSIQMNVGRHREFFHSHSASTISLSTSYTSDLLPSPWQLNPKWCSDTFATFFTFYASWSQPLTELQRHDLPEWT